MKNLNYWGPVLAVFVLTFTSCSDDTPVSKEQEKVMLSFSAILEDLDNSRTGLRQALGDIPECSEEDAVYVEVIVSSGGASVVGSQGNPFRINLVAGQVFTQEMPELELTPGQYSLDYFAVFDANNNAIWVAPMAGSEMANWIQNPLPLNFDLGAGVKKYVEVPVLCFDDRQVNAYGYLFFNLVPGQAIEWCIFGNYCDDSGRHYPAAFSVNIWNYANGQVGTQLYNNLSNEVALNDAGDYAGSTVCVALPDTSGLDEYYVEITLLNSDAYGSITERVIREGVLTDADVRNLFSGENAVDYFHFREGCDGVDSPNIFSDDAASTTYFGPTQPMGEGVAQSMIRLSSSGDPELIGIRVTGEALEGLPQEQEHLTLTLPAQAEGLVFDHIDLEWNPNGHEPPGIYDIPHFDIHFYMISIEDKMNITDAALADILPAEQYWPQTYFPTPGFVPMMGKHWLSSEAEELNGEVFDQTFIYGSYDASFIFYEPMITLDHLRGQPNETFAIHQPAEFERTGYYYPTSYSITYDASTNEYFITLQDMVLR